MGFLAILLFTICIVGVALINKFLNDLHDEAEKDEREILNRMFREDESITDEEHNCTETYYLGKKNK